MKTSRQLSVYTGSSRRVYLASTGHSELSRKAQKPSFFTAQNRTELSGREYPSFSQWKELISNRGISSFSGKLSNIKVLQLFILELLDNSLGVSGYKQLLVGGQNKDADL